MVTRPREPRDVGGDDVRGELRVQLVHAVSTKQLEQVRGTHVIR